jgi:alkylhydroperoxidase/carboxymuconolactone decarboxylase family protein YurZ
MSGEEHAELIEKTRAVRGYLNPGHEYLAGEDPEFLRTYNALAGIALKHGEREADGERLEAKYCELIACAILAYRGVAEESIAGHLRRAMRLGATEAEAVGAFEATVIPGGAPAMLHGMRVLNGMRKGIY